MVTIHDLLKNDYVLKGIPESKVLVLEDGVDLKRFDLSDDKMLWRHRLGLDTKKHYAVYCGHLYPEKGIEVILLAAKQLAYRNDIEFLLVGGLKKFRLQWEKYCLQNNIKNVTFVGFVPNASVPQYLKSADCLLLPYKLKDMEYRIMDIETTSPLKLFEYMASKRPIIATDIPTIRKVLKHETNSLLVMADDIEAFCSKIKRILFDHSLSEQLAKRAYQDSLLYSWDERCKKIIDFFHQT